MSNVVTLATLTTVVSGFSDEFSCVRVGQGKNLKITFADLRGAGSEAPDGVSPDEHKYTQMIRLCRHLRSQGIPASFSASFDTGKKDAEGRAIRVPYPAVYVNNEPRTPQQRNEALAEAKSEIAELKALVAQLVAAQAPKPAAPAAKTETPAPEAAGPEF